MYKQNHLTAYIILNMLAVTVTILSRQKLFTDLIFSSTIKDFLMMDMNLTIAQVNGKPIHTINK